VATDGKDFTADDVKYTFDRDRSRGTGWLAYRTSVRAVKSTSSDPGDREVHDEGALRAPCSGAMCPSCAARSIISEGAMGGGASSTRSSATAPYKLTIT